MGFEVELKFPVPDRDDLARRLAERGAKASEPLDHEDLYFAHPSRDFAATGEAFRIRGEGLANRITYKGSKRSDAATKTREEIELGFDPGPEARGDLRLVFERLGFRVVAAVRKRRESYELAEAGRLLTVVIDDVESLGTFAEVEALVADEADLAAGQGAVLALAEALGLGQPEPRSYLRMVLEAAGALPRNSAGRA